MSKKGFTLVEVLLSLSITLYCFKLFITSESFKNF